MYSSGTRGGWFRLSRGLVQRAVAAVAAAVVATMAAPLSVAGVWGSSGSWNDALVGDGVRLAAADRKHEDSGQQQAEDNVFEHQLAVSVSGKRAAADFGCRA
jgi:hypothetical protein